MTPHPYQLNYRAAIRKGWDDGFKRQLVVSPTGSGKTCMFSWETQAAVHDLESVLILVDQDELVWQTIAKLREVAGIHAEPEKAEYRASAGASVVVATVQSMARRLDNWPQNTFGLVIADEADKSISPQWQTVLKHFDSESRVLGFTATPHRTDKRNLGIYYENAIELENLKTLIQKGFLSPIKIQMLPIKLDVGGRSNGRDFTDDEADEIITPHLEEIARAIQIHAQFRKTLVFLPLIKTCEKFNDIARSIGLNADYIYGVDPLRESKLRQFKSGDIEVLANSMLLTRGVDIPETDCIVPARPTKSVTLYFQMCGRGTRVARGKEDCLLLDFLYQSLKRLVCRPARLLAQSDEEEEQITKLTEELPAGLPGEVVAQLDLMELAATASSQREEALRKKLEENRNKKAQTISAAEFALKNHSLDTAEFEPVMDWEKQPVTDKQAKYLKQAGIDLDTVSGKGHASKLLSLYFTNKPLRLASHGQRAQMRRHGHANWENATEAEAKQFFAQIRKPKESMLL